MIITISGLPGSGKSTVGRLLAEQIGYKFYSVGDFRGEMAQKLGLTIDELNKVGQKEFWTDQKADDWQKKIGQTENNVVIDGWLAFHFVPKSFKIFIEVQPKFAAHRIFINQRPDEKYLDSEAGVAEQISHRLEETRNRLLKYYQVDFLNKDYYDLIIDSTNISPEEVTDKIIKKLNKKNK
jgi:CMP/dCMP kinase